MRRILAAVVGVVSVVALSAACKKDDPPPAPPITPYAQPGYNTAPTTAPPPTVTAPVPGQMSVPGPTALACSNDSQCMTHHCNMQYQKCAFPCQSDADCIQGASCFIAGGPAAACLPKPPGSQ